VCELTTSRLFRLRLSVRRTSKANAKPQATVEFKKLFLDGCYIAMSLTIDLQDDLVQRQAEARQISLQEWVIRVLSPAPEFPDY
jgi:hypothetical protein